MVDLPELVAGGSRGPLGFLATVALLADAPVYRALGVGDDALDHAVLLAHHLVESGRALAKRCELVKVVRHGCHLPSSCPPRKLTRCCYTRVLR